MIENAGGHIEVRSQLDQGSIFLVYLPQREYVHQELPFGVNLLTHRLVQAGSYELSGPAIN
ncbi:hypothetical protein [Hymenobacter cavernae]|uniref:Histidine kinase/HSP90-like ATPase domain-containing protein n=1 Tax=Hymenobacter cavernae TaxID=2044852 RepID=A0ABQ1TZ82_9BACT|nr:hypothetical protein [Hymenobacter cavernae]GGF06106.1 hypothetical protein GCM10011383_16510 [Hymenobacter cavernae]